MKMLFKLLGIVPMLAVSIVNASGSDNSNCVNLILEKEIAGGGKLYEAGLSYSELLRNSILPNNYIIIRQNFTETNYQDRQELGQIINFVTGGGLDYSVAHTEVSMKTSNRPEAVIIKTTAKSTYNKFDEAVAEEESQAKAIKKVISYIQKNNIQICE